MAYWLRDNDDGLRGRGSGCRSGYDSDGASSEATHIAFPHDEGDDCEYEDEYSDDNSGNGTRCESGFLGGHTFCRIAA